MGKILKIAVVAVATFVLLNGLLVTVGLVVWKSLKTPLPDKEIRRNFKEHREEFEKLRDMLVADRLRCGLKSVTPATANGKKVQQGPLSGDRHNHYSRLLRATGVSMASIHGSRRTFYVWLYGGFPVTKRKMYKAIVFDTTVKAPSLGTDTSDGEQHSEYAYTCATVLDSGWFIEYKSEDVQHSMGF